jgi:cytochrome c oxidase cbb3-type subunit III
LVFCIVQVIRLYPPSRSAVKLDSSSTFERGRRSFIKMDLVVRGEASLRLSVLTTTKLKFGNLRDLLACCAVLLLASASPAQSPESAKPSSGNPSAALFATNCAVCHGSDGRGGERAPNIATEREIVALSDAQLHDILNKGVLASGMPPFGFLGEEKIKALVEYLRVLQGAGGSAQAKLPGDPAAGEQLFFGAASCSSCHMMNGRGGFLGDDLSAFAKGHSADAVRAAIVHPDDSPAGHMVEVQTTQGNAIKGLIRGRDNFNIVLQSEDGAFHSVASKNISQITTSAQPLMPQNYGTKLDSKQIDDLISYLLKNAGSSKPAAEKDDDED